MKINIDGIYYWNIIEIEARSKMFQNIKKENIVNGVEIGYTYSIHILTLEKVTYQMMSDLTNKIMKGIYNVEYVTRFKTKDKFSKYKPVEVYDVSNLSIDLCIWNEKYILGKDFLPVREIPIEKIVFNYGQVRTCNGTDVIMIS